MFGLLLLLTLSGADADTSSAPDKLTKADIPADLAPELKKLIEETFSDNHETRKQAVKELGALGERAVSAVPFMLRLFWAGNILDQFEVSSALVQIGDPAADACIAAINRSMGKVRIDLIWRLGPGQRTPRILDAVTALLYDSDIEVRRAAAKSLYYCDDPRVVPHLIRAFQDPDAEVRQAAIEYFEMYPNDRAVEPLIKALVDPVRSVRELAVLALESQNDLRAKALAKKRKLTIADDPEETRPAISGIQWYRMALLCVAVSSLFYLRRRYARRAARRVNL